MIFYQIENSKVVGACHGTYRVGDPTSTWAVMETWAMEKAGRKIIVGDSGDVEDPEYLKVSGSTVLKMTAEEKDQVTRDKNSRNEKIKSDRESGLAKLASSAGLNADEKAALNLKLK